MTRIATTIFCLLLALWSTFIPGRAWTNPSFLRRRYCFCCCRRRSSCGSRRAFDNACCALDESKSGDPSDNGSSFNKGDYCNPTWQGSSYSWTPPSRSRRRTNRNEDGRVVVDLAHCGTVEIEQRPSRVGLSSRTGVALWSASYSIADYIDDRCGTRSWNPRSGKLACLELGAGLGLPSIVAAKHGFDCWATECDPAVLPLLTTNLEKNLAAQKNNSNTLQAKDGTVRVQSLNWTDDLGLHPELVEFDADLIVASDLIYKDTQPAWEALVSLLDRLRDEKKKRNALVSTTTTATSNLIRFDGTPTPPDDPLVLLGYTHRRRNLSVREERDFFAMLRKSGIRPVPIPHDLVPNSEQRIMTTLFELRWN